MKAIVVIPSPNLDRENSAAYALAAKGSDAMELSCLILGTPEATDAEPFTPLLPTIRVNDRALEGMDDFTLGYVIAEFIRSQGADIVILGEMVDSEGLGILPALVAHHAGFPLFSQVTSLGGDDRYPNQLVLETFAGGKQIKIAVPPPVVLAASSALEPAVVRSPHATLTHVNLDTLKLDPTKLVARPNHLGDLEHTTPKSEPPPGGVIRELLKR